MMRKIGIGAFVVGASIVVTPLILFVIGMFWALGEAFRTLIVEDQVAFKAYISGQGSALVWMDSMISFAQPYFWSAIATLIIFWCVGALMWSGRTK